PYTLSKKFVTCNFLQVELGTSGSSPRARELSDLPVQVGFVAFGLPSQSGALGAVTISLEGIFQWNNAWKTSYNYWHIGRPFFGAVLGIVAFFMFVVIVSASGNAPTFLDGKTPPLPKDCIIYYVLAFLVGYREETFRDLIKRVTDLILKPGTPTPQAAKVVFKVGGTPQSTITVPAIPATQTSRVTVEVQNAGDAPLVKPTVAVSATAPAAATTFATANDQVSTGHDLDPGQSRTVDITFTAAAPGAYAGRAR
ncbi:MAG TPA: hypothetical protein VGQ29_15640, partial [Gemmatimonadales bacterium]|nr:hypothetical protein [Gemmatimonadales bacterium]